MWVESLLELLSKIFTPLLAFYAGRTSKEVDELKDENEKLKKYKDIDNTDYDNVDVYSSRVWK